ncbi:MAG TPA: riboflavin biosynthesis protein RibF [Caulobacteraceae bacterium]|jgi:riboflavin kinase/FMN adenylyltransferase
MSLRIVNGWRDLPTEARGASVALGNFDGVHRGHRLVIAEAAKAARALKAPLGVIRFTPHPAALLRPDAEPYLLMTPGQQARALEALGVDLLYDLPFDQITVLTDEAFARDVLAAGPHGGLGARHVAAGFDIRFGHGRSGDAESLKRLGEQYGFSVSIAPRVDEDGAKLSSSAAREAVRAGEVDKAAKILGRPFAIEGVVVEGQHLGRKLGYPTANVFLGDYVRPRLGSYATRTRLPDGRVVPGVANIGQNPTTGLVDARLEVWLFDFDEDLYGQTIETELVAFLRPEAKFDSLDELIRVIGEDAAAARAMLCPEL